MDGGNFAYTTAKDKKFEAASFLASDVSSKSWRFTARGDTISWNIYYGKNEQIARAEQSVMQRWANTINKG